MPKDLVGLVAIIVVATFLIYSIVTFGSENSRNKDLVGNMTQTIQTTAVNSFDNSSRVSEGNSEFNKTVFEKNFEDNFNKQNNMKLESKSFKFDYLKSGASVKAIRVTLTDDRGAKYTSTVALDITNK